jgi:hypothetical protein
MEPAYCCVGDMRIQSITLAFNLDVMCPGLCRKDVEVIAGKHRSDSLTAIFWHAIFASSQVFHHRHHIVVGVRMYEWASTQ